MKNVIKSVLGSISCMKRLESIPSIPIVNERYYQRLKSISKLNSNKKFKYDVWKQITIYILFIFKLYCHKHPSLKFFIKDSCYSIIEGLNFNLGTYEFVLYSKVNYNDIIDNIEMIDQKIKNKIKYIISCIKDEEVLENTLSDIYMVIFKFDQDFHTIKKYFGIKNHDVFPSFMMKQDINKKFMDILVKKQKKSKHYSNKIISYCKGSGLEFKMDPKSSIHKMIKNCKLLISNDSDKIELKLNLDLTCSIPITTSDTSSTTNNTSDCDSVRSSDHKSNHKSNDKSYDGSYDKSCGSKSSSNKKMSFDTDNGDLFIESDSNGIG